MEITEIGLSHRQRITETCFSGYVEVTDKEHDFIIGVKFHEPFAGDGVLFVELLNDDDDGFYAADTIRKYGPFPANKIHTGLSICMNNFVNEITRYICLRYVVEDGFFTSGEITARITSYQKPWFINCDREVWNDDVWTGEEFKSD